MTSPDHLERLVELFQSSTISQSMGLTLHYDDEQRAVFELPYDGRFDHFLDDVHGGAIATMIDNAGWFAAAARATRPGSSRSSSMCATTSRRASRS